MSEPSTPIVFRSATELSTLADIWGVFRRSASPRLLMLLAIVLVVSRGVAGGFGRGDVAALVVTLALTGTVEWVIHKFLLHAPLESFRMNTLKTGRGHREHHLDPNTIGWILLSRADVVAFMVAFAAFSVLWGLPLFALIGANIGRSILSALTLACLGLLHYEWTHLMVHTRYRPSTRFYASLARNHRLHHFRNEDYWLGVTSNSGDRLLRTLPADKGDVPLSETARTLS